MNKNLIVLVNKSIVEAIVPGVAYRIVNRYGSRKPLRVGVSPVESLREKWGAIYVMQSLTKCRASKPETSRGFMRLSNTEYGGKNVYE